MILRRVVLVSGLEPPGSLDIGVGRWLATWSRRSQGEFVERDGQPPVRWFLDGQFIVTSSKILDERVPARTMPALRSCLRSPSRLRSISGTGSEGAPELREPLWIQQWQPAYGR